MSRSRCAAFRSPGSTAASADGSLLSRAIRRNEPRMRVNGVRSSWEIFANRSLFAWSSLVRSAARSSRARACMNAVRESEYIA